MANLLEYSTAGSWTNAFAAADFNALANGSSIISSATAVANGAGSILADLSFIMVTSTMSPTAAGGAGLDFYLLPLLHDGTTYPDGESTATAANQATGTYFVGRMVLRGKATSTQAGALRGIVVPNGTFKWYVINSTGAALPSSASNMTCQYRLYGYDLNA